MVFVFRHMNNFDSVNHASLLVSLNKLIAHNLTLSVRNVEIEEVVCWVIDLVLSNSLKGKSLLAITNLDKVSSFNSDTVSIFVFLPKRLSDTLEVVWWSFSILHEFNGAWGDWSTTLRSIIHYSELSLRINILDWDGWINWVIVVRNFLGSIEVPSGSVILNSFLHFETIRIGVESLIIVEITDTEVWNNFISIHLFLKWQTIKVYVDLYQRKVFVDGNMNITFHGLIFLIEQVCSKINIKFLSINSLCNTNFFDITIWEWM